MKARTWTVCFPSREFYRATSKRPDANRAKDQSAQASNQVSATTRFKAIISNEINPPEVLSNRDAVTQSKLRRNKKQQTNNERGNKTLNLTGNVDLGSNVFKQNRLARRRNQTRKNTKTTIVTTPHPNTILEILPANHHRHNHYDNRQIHGVTPTPYQRETASYRPETTTRAYVTTTTRTAQPSRTENSTMMSAKVIEKVIKVLRRAQCITQLWHVCSRNNGWRTSDRSCRICQRRRSLNLWKWKRSEKLRRTRAWMTRFRKSFSIAILLHHPSSATFRSIKP